MAKHYFWLRHPHKHSQLASPEEKRIEVVPGKTLGDYLRELDLTALRLRTRVVRLRDAQPVRNYYVPQSGDVISMLPGGGSSL